MYHLTTALINNSPFQECKALIKRWQKCWEKAGSLVVGMVQKVPERINLVQTLGGSQNRIGCFLLIGTSHAMFPGVIGIEVWLVLALWRVPNRRIDIEILISTSTTNRPLSATIFRILR